MIIIDSEEVDDTSQDDTAQDNTFQDGTSQMLKIQGGKLLAQPSDQGFFRGISADDLTLWKPDS